MPALETIQFTRLGKVKVPCRIMVLKVNRRRQPALMELDWSKAVGRHLLTRICEDEDHVNVFKAWVRPDEDEESDPACYSVSRIEIVRTMPKGVAKAMQNVLEGR